MLHEDSFLFAIRDINPRAPIHVLIVPRRHFADGAGADAGAGAAAVAHGDAWRTQLADQLEIGERGYRLTFNVGEEGGQTIYHVHMHLLGGQALGPEA